jgi:hypothetical protein
VKPSSIVPYEHKIITDAYRLDEGTLGNGDNLFHARGKPGGEDFGYNLSESINEPNRAKI